MNVLIIYFSQIGNTEKIAKTNEGWKCTERGIMFLENVIFSKL